MLESWNEGRARSAIIAFVERVTRPGRDFVPPEARVAVFDNDGTTWCEKPLPVQGDFLLRRMGETVKERPELRDHQPWRAAAELDYDWLSNVITKHYQGDDGDLKTLAGGLLQAYAGSTIEEFEAQATAFLRSGVNPRLKRPYVQCAYRPMVELVRYLTEQGFTSYMASGGGRDFMRAITQDLYGIPPERVIGSTATLSYRDHADFATIVHDPALDVLDDGPAKPVRIWSRVGRRPILAAGNTNGDIPMLRFCAHPSRPSLALLLDHDDSEREFAYQAGAEQALDRARRSDWTIVSMKRDWKTVFVEPT
ncbi:MAG TPA: HAD family hydrolase [Polyangia bacterium]|nr:HAD family hydrolase [Polyangia bacterium]